MNSIKQKKVKEQYPMQKKEREWWENNIEIGND